MKSLSVCLSLIALSWAVSASAIEVPLTYEEYPEDPEHGAFFPYDGRVVSLSLTPPKGKWRMPPFLRSTRPIYFRIELGGQTRLGLLDKAKDGVYRRLYLDLNGNRNLGDDKPIEAEWDRRRDYGFMLPETLKFPPCSMMVFEGGEMVPYRFRVRMYFPDRGSSGDRRIPNEEILRSADCDLSPQCWYRGRVQVGGETYEICLSDDNVNGLFDEPPALYRPRNAHDKTERISAYGTHIYATRDRTPSSYDAFELGDVLVLRDRTFKVDLDIPRRRLVLEPMAERLATLDLAMPPSGLLLSPEGEGPWVTMIDPGKQAKIPQGVYRLVSYRVFGEGTNKDVWSLNAAGTFGSPVVTVGSEGARLGFGEPFAPSVETRIPGWDPARGQRPRITRVSLRFAIEGTMKERVTDLRHLEGKPSIEMATSKGDQNRPKAPTFRIAKKDGEAVHSGSFSYG